jgi:hypothetical protein
MPLELTPSFAWCAAIIIFFSLSFDINGNAKSSALVWLCLMVGAVLLFASAALMAADTFGLLPSFAVALVLLTIFELAMVRRFQLRSLPPQEH